MVTGNMYRNFVKFGHVGFEICEWTDRQTHRHISTLITVACLPGHFNTDGVSSISENNFFTRFSCSYLCN